MKTCKIFCLVIAILMMLTAMVACGGEPEDTTPDTTDDTVKRDPIVVNIIVRASQDGEDLYASDSVTGYTFEGAVASPLAILEEFMDFEHDIVIEYDENDTLKKVGDLEATDGHLFLWDLAKAPLDAENATPMNQGLDEYTEIKNGDTIIIYLS